MQRIRALALILFLGACSSAKAPPAGEAPKTGWDAAAGLTEQQTAQQVGTGVPTPPPPADPRESLLAEATVQLLEEQHLIHPKLDDKVSQEAFNVYMDRIDAGKMFLLKADRDGLAHHAMKIDDQLRAGKIDLAHDGADVFAARVAVVEKMVASILTAPMDFSNEEFIELDSKKVQPATTEEELADRWRRRLELEVMERVAGMEDRLKPKDPKKTDAADPDEDRSPVSAIPATPELREAKAREDLAKQYSGRFARLRAPGALDAAADVVNAVAAALDPHTEYLPPAESANFDISMSGSLEGIGAVLREKDHYIEVSEIVPGGASSRQGELEAGDLILSVQQEGAEPVDTFDRRIDEVVKMIRGKKGTVVKLRVQKPANVEKTISITRDIVVIEDTYARGAVLERKGKPSYGYIHVPGFYGKRGNGTRAAGADVDALLTKLKGKKIAGVILDLRSNGGGLLDEAVTMTGSFIDRGPVVQVKDNDGEHKTLSDETGGVTYDGPLLVLVDRFSASASEIVAGALQDYHRAIIVGAGPSTHGKGTVQTLVDLDRLTGGKVELGELKLTIQQFFRVTGSSTQVQGVIPDVMLPDPAGYIESGEKTLDHALAWSSIQPEQYAKSSDKWTSEALAKKSAARIAKQPVLAKVATTTELLKARQADTRVPLQRTAWEKRRADQRAALDAASPELDKQPAAFTVIGLDEPAADKQPVDKKAPTAADPKKPLDRAARWRDTLSKDPWVAECLNILADAK